MKKIITFFEKFENFRSIVAVKNGLIMIIPILMIGSATLVLKYFPLTAYQNLIEKIWSGNLINFLDLIYNATFGMLSVFLTLTISFCYARQFDNKKMPLAYSITALLCFFVLSGIQFGTSKIAALGVKGMFVSIFSAIFADKLLFYVISIFRKKSQKYTDESEIEFNNSVSLILPISIVIVLFSLFNTLISFLFHLNSFFELFVHLANNLFKPLGRSIFSGILMVIVSSILWFFGIHGSNVLESVMSNVFTPAIDINIYLASLNKIPTEILTKEFFDVFVLMGGCGTSICLLLSILFFSKRKSSRRLSKLAAIPMLFNINELMIFGFPIIFNPTMFIPFVLTPLISFFTTYIAMYTKIVPLTISKVNWTAPVFISGYTATGSVFGSLMQLFNIVLGIAIYRPFVLRYDQKSEKAAMKQLSGLIDVLKESEKTTIPIALTELTDSYGSLARSLLKDLEYYVSKNNVELYYQPQYNNNRICVGVEALLRWKHPLYGVIYPPLAIKLAQEGGFLCEFEMKILKRAIDDGQKIRSTGYNKDISVNVSAPTIQSDEFFNLLKTLIEKNYVKFGEICLEITEQAALLSSQATFSRLREIKDLGFFLAIDDFSMGHTSLTYLQENHFDIVKLDGAIVRSLLTNPRSLDIIKSITALSKNLGFSVIAEYVQDEKQMKMLENIGCLRYQGYLFSKPLSRDTFILQLKNEIQASV